MRKSKLDDSWEKLFEKYDILTKIDKDGFFDITATQINEFREARLMTKLDNRESLPKLFKDNKLSILPITRGSYIIGKFDAYQDVKYNNVEVKKFLLPSHIKGIEPSNIYSEAIALNSTFSSGVISDILGEECLPTISGRMSTSSFDFDIKMECGNKFIIKVVNSQCEIDGGYESKHKIALVEAKNAQANNFLIRQLYYPFRLWKNKVPNKEIIPILMTYSNDLYSFFIYKFTKESEYNSLELVEQRNYRIDTKEI